MSDQPLHLQLNGDNSSYVVTVNPVVLLSILDHFIRRNENQQRVIGTLLGVRSEDGSEVEIKNCFPVSHSEDDDQVAVDMEFHSTMFALHQKVNPKEVIVGWYATGNSINNHSNWIHEFYGKEVAPFQPVHLLLDAALTGNQLGLKAFVSSPVGLPDNVLGSVFSAIPCDVKYAAEEKNALEIIQSAKDKEDGNVSLFTDVTSLKSNIQSVRDMISRILEYIDSVLDGKTEANEEIGRFLMDTVSLIPKYDGDEFEKAFNGHIQDILMVVYLSNLARTQLALAEKLQTAL